jgi:hypothetical protein
MPITPDEARRIREEQGPPAHEVDAYERLDKSLTELVSQPPLAHPLTHHLHDVPDQVARRILVDWKAAGWQIRIVEDRRDGDYIRIN